MNYVIGGFFIIFGLLIIFYRTLPIGDKNDNIVAVLEGPLAIVGGIAIILIGIVVVLFT